MRFAIFPQSCVPFHAKTLDERPLGGIETGIIRLAEALDQRGHSVIVFTPETNPPPSQPPYYHLSKVNGLQEVDVFICVREWFPLIQSLPAKVKLFWTGDAADQVQSFGIGDKRVSRLVDGFLAVSQWHAKNIATESGFPIEKIEVIKNGVHIPYFEGNEVKQAKHLIYASTPFRGLSLLPVLFPIIKEKHPEAELHIFSGTNAYKGNTPSPYLESVDRQFSPVFDKLRSLPGVTVHGNVSQAELAKAYMRSGVLCYPNTFLETSCITVMEAQTAGCIPVTSKLAALEETVGECGILIDGQPGSDSYNMAFVEAVNSLLADPAKFNQLSEAAKVRGRQEHSWQSVAERLEKYLASKFKLL